MNENYVIIYVGGADFTQVGPFMGFNQFRANSQVRKDCFNIAITNDAIYETDESFTLVLRQDPFSPLSSSILIQPSTTTVTILDESGMYTRLPLRLDYNSGSTQPMCYYSVANSLVMSVYNLVLLEYALPNLDSNKLSHFKNMYVRI